MRILLSLLLLCLTGGVISGPSLAAGTELYVCTDSNGVRTYQNSDAGQGCVLLNLNPITVVPSPKERKPVTRRADDGAYPDRDAKDGDSKSYSRTPIPAFDASDDRVRILQEELRVEEGKLANLQKEYKNGQPERQGDEKNYQRYLDRTARLEQEIRSTQENVEILKREVGKLLR